MIDDYKITNKLLSFNSFHFYKLRMKKTTFISFIYHNGFCEVGFPQFLTQRTERPYWGVLVVLEVRVTSCEKPKTQETSE